MNIKSQKDFFAGLLYAAVGCAFAIGATNYNIGTGARMGPGYFPLMLGVLLCLIGLYIMFKSLVVETADGDKIGKWAWKPLFFIIAGNLLFGVLLSGLPNLGIPGMGLIVAIYGVTIVVSKAGGEANIKESLILATILSTISYLGFIKLLNLQFPVWPSFITG
ncbi:MAG: tripartite tricarboxylate transporter TctB family protein [Limnohabitans sp.]|nr:tripartite tricarboxylate transporter TctB family protein [Limnohabitans sp.]MDP4733177.1 tripartite tricarboxylate transporter TctB family protein [Limnohabitans sp.]MDP4771818.1 tripartite tricarboxylate transporter TctB family protein [Limnohabitans sp.]